MPLNLQGLEEKSKALRGRTLQEQMENSADGQELIVRIPLTQGFTAIVSLKDFVRIKNFIWHAGRMSGAIRAKRSDYSKKENGEVIFLHTEITGLKLVDHKNRNTLDNTGSNLRPCSHQQNSHNRSVPKMKFPRSSEFKGVSWHKRIKRWGASIGFNGKRMALGYFDSPQEAAIAYNNAAIKLFGDFAAINLLSGNNGVPKAPSPI